MNEWRDAEIKNWVERELHDRLTVLGKKLEYIVDLNVSGQGDPALEAVDFGQHKGSIYSEVKEDKLQVGFDGTAGHSFYVEVGTEKMPARPSLRRAVYDNKKLIVKMIGEE